MDLNKVREGVRRIQAVSAERLMGHAATVGAAMLLVQHFGSAQAVRDAGLVNQLRVLVQDIEGEPEDLKWFRALEWAHLKIPYSKPSRELDQMVSQILAAGRV